MDMIDGGYYFLMRAPRQSGKTTYLNALRDQINKEGKYYALLCSLEALDGVSDTETATVALVSQINDSLKFSKVEKLVNLFRPDNLLPNFNFSLRIRSILNYICENLDKDLILFFDEADCLAPEPLIPFLRQIRQGYNMRDTASFPRSLALIGMRDIRDYLSQVRPDSESALLASPFNITKGSLSLANFTQKDIKALYAQHTEATGQKFQPAAIDRACRWSGGQPWLINSLAFEIVERSLRRDYSKAITGKHMDQAAQALILRGETHFDSLRKRLKEPRVRRIMEAVLVGAKQSSIGISEEDLQYAIDLGLLKKDSNDSYQPANPIYQEIIIRALTFNFQKGVSANLPDNIGREWMDGKNLDMSALLLRFQAFWRENREMLATDNAIDSFAFNDSDQAARNLDITENNGNQELPKIIKNRRLNLDSEALAHLVLLAFSRRVLNGGADFVQREFALGRMRADICVSYKDRRYPLEMKVKGVLGREKSFSRLLLYMDKCGASEGWLVVFDQDFQKPWDKKLTWETLERDGQTIHVVGR